MKKRIITGNVEISDSVFVLSFERDFDFIPGQVIGISGRVSDAPRLYSIASGNKESQIRILYDIKEGGELTPWLALQQEGDEVFTTEISGNFHSSKNEEAYWIASGTGIAAFSSMFYSGLYSNKHLIHGGRFLHSFYFQEEFENELKDRYIRCCTKEEGKGIYRGRLTDYLRNKEDLNPTNKYYLCGSAEMVVETRDILLVKKIPFENVIGEIYF